MLGAVWSAICVSIALGIVCYTIWRCYHWSTYSREEIALLDTTLVDLGQLRSRLAAGYQPAPLELDAALSHYLSSETRELLTRTGVPLQPLIKALETGIRNRRQFDQHLWTQLAGVRATTLILTQLPLLGIVLGYVLGAHPIHFLTSSYGTLLLLAGVCCQSGGVWWIGRMVNSIPIPRVEETLPLHILSALLDIGIPLRLAHHILPDQIMIEYQTVLDQAQQEGAPIATLIADLAADRSAHQISNVDQHLEELGVLLARPLGLCFLPGFLLLGMLPAIIELGGSLLALS